LEARDQAMAFCDKYGASKGATCKLIMVDNREMQ
jgi:hypothetical protein